MIKKIKGVERLFGLMFKSKECGPIMYEFEEDVQHPIHSLFVFFTFKIDWYTKEGDLIESKIVTPFKVNIKPEVPYRYFIETPI